MSFLLQTAVALYMVLLESLHFGRRFGELNRTADTDPRARTRFYRFYMALEWGLVAVIGLALAMGRILPARLGLQPPVFDDPQLLAEILLAVAVGLTLPVALSLLRPGSRHKYSVQLESLGQTKPYTGRERWYWTAAAVTAGITEEVRFRGFLTFYIAALLPGLSALTVVGAVSVLFGLAHWYQGWKGVLTTGIAGACFGALAFATQSLFPGILIHALMDLRLLGLLWATEH
jgi:uncharacterized protein